MQKLIVLKKTDDFSSVFSFRKRISSSFFVIHFKPNATQQLRVGFVVAKKIAKLAVDRNYMRRVLREYIRHEAAEGLSLDLVIQVQKKFDKKDFNTIKQELNVVLDKICSRLA